MILTCPSCQSQYLVPDGSIGEEGRMVKCTNCAHKWHQAGQEDEIIYVDAEVFQADEPQEIDSPLDDSEDELERFYEEPMPVMDETEGASVNFKAIAFAFIVFMSLIGSVLTSGRYYFVEKWEPLAALFETIGLPVPVAGEGLVLDSVTANIEELEGERVLIVKGRIDNASDVDIALPVLKISSYVDNDWLKDWMIPLGGKIMQSKQSIAFDYRLSDIPSENHKIVVSFAYQ